MFNHTKHVVFCDGGLSNRLNALIFALILKEKYAQEWDISWPINNWCGAKFSSLFTTNLNVNTNNLSYYKEMQNGFTLIFHENQANFKNEIINFNSNLKNYDDYEKLLKLDKPVIYFNNLIPGFTTTEDIKTALGNIGINNEILAVAKDFCIQYKIDDSTLGLHIRKTDFGNNVDENALYELVKNSEHKFFVCSDAKEVNDLFGQLDNCIVFEKTHFPSKINQDHNFQHSIVDDQGRAFNSNIFRSDKSIKEALVDLLILSKTTHINTSHSTFLLMSKIFKATSFFNVLG
jgi:hypothetical protein